MSIFRRFGELNVQNILFLQAELAYLEDQLDQIRREDGESNEKSTREKGNLMQSFYALRQAHEDDQSSEQYATVLQIQDKLKQYSKYYNPQGRVLVLANRLFRRGPYSV